VNRKAFETLPAYFQKRLLPALQTLLDAAVAAGEVRTGVEADDLLSAVGNLCRQDPGDDPDRARRMVAILTDGLRYGASPSVTSASQRGSAGSDPDGAERQAKSAASGHARGAEAGK